MHIPKTIINKLIPFFLKYPPKPIFGKAKASIDRQATKGYLEVVSNINWARIITNNLDEMDLFEEPTEFVIEQDSLEEIGYRDFLQEAALGYDEIELEEYLPDDEPSSDTERLKELAELANNLPLFENPYSSGNQLLSISLSLDELKKIIDLAIAIAESSQIHGATITFQFKTDSSPVYWKLNDSPYCNNYASYTADGIVMPVKIKKESNFSPSYSPK